MTSRDSDPIDTRNPATEQPRKSVAIGSYCGGQIGEGLDLPAFQYNAPTSMPLPVLIAVPHAGRAYPQSVLDQMRDQELCQLRLEDRYIDHVALAIAKQTGTGFLLADAPRALLDLNRSHTDVDWGMVQGAGRQRVSHRTNPSRRARNGLGLVPRRLPGFGEIWREPLPRGTLDRRIETIHRPYHQFLTRELEAIRDSWGAALLIDLHSMPPLRSAGESRPAPRIVLGDRFGASCASSMVARAFRYLDDQPFTSAHNRPYAGGYVLDRHAAPSRGIHAMQIEVCRSQYLDDQLSEPTGNIAVVAKMLAGLVRELGAETARFGSATDMAQAAE